MRDVLLVIGGLIVGAFVFGFFKAPSATEPRPRPAAERKTDAPLAFLHSVTLAVNGGFYAVGLHGRVWRVIDDTAIPVQGIPEKIWILELIPSTNGDVYARSLDRIFRIQNGVASPVETLETKNARRPANQQFTWLENLPATDAERRAFVLAYHVQRQLEEAKPAEPYPFDPDP